MKILVTGFDPFGGQSVNPAYEAVRLLPDQIRTAAIIKAQIPTIFGQGADLLEQMTGIRADVMPDPVCLLDRAAWEETAAPGPEGEPYILCYFIGENEEYAFRVKQLQAETGLRVLDIPVNAASYRSGRELLDGIGPREFLGAVRNAAVLCTDSFHGLAFATIFGVRTELIRRYREDDPESKNIRVDHFLRLVNEKGMEQIREEGTAWLRNALSKNQ